MQTRLRISSASQLLFALLVGFGIAEGSPAVAQAQSTLPAFVDLTNDQTPIRDQGNRRTCIIHSVTAGMEAALKRAGYGEVDLSEDAFMYFVKLFWMNDSGKGAAAGENQIGGSDGGSALENLHYLAGGLAIPEESTGWADGHDYKIPFPWDNPHWISQFNLDSWNLSSRQLQPSILQAPHYFTVTSFRELPDATNAAAIEAVLNGHHEVIWGASFCGQRPDNAAWTYDVPAKPDSDGHSMLIVGYDRRDTQHPYFIVKNSWGPTKLPGGYTHIAYSYLKYGNEACYITGVARRSWPELHFVGRWALHIDGREGILDITHIPGVFQGVLNQKGDKSRDNRIGMFYDQDDPNKAYRVNGSMKGNRIDFYIDSKDANAHWDRLGGRHFTYYLSAGDRDLMAGTHSDPNGSLWGGYARRLQSDDAFPAEARKIAVMNLPEMTGFKPTDQLPAKLEVESYLGSWRLQARQTTPLRLTKRDDSVVPADKQAEWAGVTGEGVVALVNKRDPKQCDLTYHSSNGKVSYHFVGRLLSHERGIVAGSLATGEPEKSKAAYGATLER
jgi:hypothetical protein